MAHAAMRLTYWRIANGAVNDNKDKMNLDELRRADYIIFSITAGSIAYGLNTPTSDIDERGIYVLPLKQRLGIMDTDQQITNDTQDIVYYDIHKYFKLATDCNPNIIEFLWSPSDCIQYVDPAGRMQQIIDNRNLFISARAYHTFSGYAYAQIKKCQGQNKLVHNPKPKDPPKKEDFCWVIPAFCKDTWGHNFGSISLTAAEKLAKLPPSRPIPLCELGIDLKYFHAAALEHASDTYRLYHYADSAKGVFRGSDMLVCENIPLEDESARFAGLLIYNKQGYDKALKEWHQYWDWIKNRNNARWEHQETGKIDYDTKNIMHCLRLLLSGKHILATGEPIVRFEGEQQAYLMEVRNGVFPYSVIMERVDKEMADMEILKSSTKLPWGADVHKINALYYDIITNSMGC